MRAASQHPPFVEHCLELLAALGTVRAKRMFGGWGLYVDELFLALIAYERLYLKADADTRAAFEAEGCEPFVYSAADKAVSLGYWAAPAEALDAPALMLPWARLALQAALRARATKLAGKPRPRPKAKPNTGAKTGVKDGVKAAVKRVKAPSPAVAGPALRAAPKARTTKTATTPEALTARPSAKKPPRA